MKDNNKRNIMEFWTRKRIPYVFDETLSLYQLVRLTIKYLNQVIEDQNELKDAIKEFIEMFDEDLQDTVIEVLEKWKDDGSLKEIINEALFESKLDKDIFNDYQIKTDERLDLIEEMFTSIKKYGAKGDGKTDDTQAFKDALKNETNIFVPDGTYIIKDRIILNQGQVLMGSNPKMQRYGGNAILKYDGNVDQRQTFIQLGANIVGGSTENQASNITLKNLTIDVNYKLGFGVYGTYVVNETLLENLVIRQSLEYGLYVAKSWYATFRRILVQDNMNIGASFGYPIKYLDGSTVSPEGSTLNMNQCTIDEIRAHYNGVHFIERKSVFTLDKSPLGSGILFGGGNGMFLRNFLSESNGGVGLAVFNPYGFIKKVQQGYVENNCQKSDIPKKETTSIHIVNEGGNHPVIIQDIIFDYSTGGGITIEGIDRTIKLINIERPNFTKYPDSMADYLILEDYSYYGIGARNPNRTLDTLVKSFTLSTKTTTEKHFVSRDESRKIMYITNHDPKASALKVYYVDGTTISLSLKGYKLGERVLLSWLENVVYVQNVTYTDTPVESAFVEVEIYKPQRMF